MNKPKELTGKVLPFIDVIRTLNIGSLENSNSVEDWIPFVGFYSQPFTPELLEYFEGWKCDNHFPDCHYTNSDLTAGYSEKHNILLLFDNNDNYWRVKTLNDFITLCTLAGVELNWKQ